MTCGDGRATGRDQAHDVRDYLGPSAPKGLPPAAGVLLLTGAMAANRTPKSSTDEARPASAVIERGLDQGVARWS